MIRRYLTPASDIAKYSNIEYLAIQILPNNQSWQIYHSVEDIDSDRGCIHVGEKGIWKIYVLYTQFCSDPKSALKYSLFKKRKNKIK